MLNILNHFSAYIQYNRSLHDQEHQFLQLKYSRVQSIYCIEQMIILQKVAYLHILCPIYQNIFCYYNIFQHFHNSLIRL